MNKLSQCRTWGEPHPKTWADYRRGCLATYGGGHREQDTIEAFRHGMETVFNLLEAEFPEAYICKCAVAAEGAEKLMGNAEGRYRAVQEISVSPDMWCVYFDHFTLLHLTDLRGYAPGAQG